MTSDFEAFKAQLNLTRDEIYRELFRENIGLIRIKKEDVAVRNLGRIIESTLKLASVKGFHAMSLRDLCADSGLSIGGVYAYIKNKDDLTHLIQSHGFILTRRTLLACTAGMAPGPDKLFAAVRAHLYLSEMMPAWFSFSFMEAKSLPKKEKLEAVTTELEIEGILFGIIQEGITAGKFRRVDARLLASLTKAMMQDWYLKRRKHRNQGTDVTHYARFVWSVLDCYLRDATVKR
ncbi:MAG TPA: TetR/AcrR family transcriptional regulator [Burkholderiaceae bacterium]|nr:TetR/AcrR family transcriptional regulator [Burkholderiaceae bacterium]